MASRAPTSARKAGFMPESQMLINYVPGEECRVAIVEDGKLEELYVEQFARASRVGNIYVGKVVNVEPAIQAAFIDFGIGENGFLHVTDLHPRYFPGEDDDATERVGFKTPRRERPPIQAALRRGDEVIVQVLKEGVGTKGPTVTSYLSIPGRFLVMMPWMDKVGVSRKVEDEDLRKKMREILDQLELPDGFGFILRTAGMDRTKLELKRDLAYLLRLWKDMDRRLSVGGKPRLLYSESDLLVRAIRDMLTTEIDQVVIDHDSAIQRAARFMKIVAPRSATKLIHYPGSAPIFHAFGIERQISLIHAREVPLPSGGRLVIDQTEALVAIDVNSGKSRDSRDSETNAYQTNVEAVDEICRQLRLRDMGGIVINDLIDMRDAKHRKDIEKRFQDRFKRDRAKTTTSTISEFGILEMTRQRMRPSHESVHFTDCPTCRGRGMLQRPDSVAVDALRELASILDVERISKVEMVVAPRVAGELLSTKRLLLSRIEQRYGKHVDVRVSDAVSVDRVSFYAYDAEGQDIDVANLPIPRKPKDLKSYTDPEVEADWAEVEEQTTTGTTDLAEPQDIAAEQHPIDINTADLDADLAAITKPGSTPISNGGQQGQGEGGGKRRRRRRRGRGGSGRDGQQAGESHANKQDGAWDGPTAPPESTEGQNGSEGARENDQAQNGSDRTDAQPGGDGQHEHAGEGGGKRRRRRRRGRGGRGGGPDGAPQQQSAPRNDNQQQRPSQHANHSPETGGDWGDDGTPAPSQAQSAAPRSNDSGRSYERPPSEGSPAAEQFDESDEPRTSDHDGGPDDGPHDGQMTGGEGEVGEGGRRKRRRRRRRGRGGRSGDGAPADGGASSAESGSGQPNAGADGSQRPQQQPRPNQPRPNQQRSPQGRDQRGAMPPRALKPAAPVKPPVAPKPAAPAPTPAPRTLYGTVRRKLSASELNKRPKPE